LALPDGSILVVEMCGGRLTRILPDGGGKTEVAAETGGGPNGLAPGRELAAVFGPVEVGERVHLGVLRLRQVVDVEQP
jgi:hypothetical protein